MAKKFILASGSPRRKEIFTMLGLDFEVDVPEVDEGQISPEGIKPDMYVQELAFLKAMTAAGAHLKNSSSYIVAADTIVSIDGEILGKPQDENEAADMLSRLSGRTHTVYTGICVVRIKDGKSECRAASTGVTFKELSQELIWRYIRTGEPMDKAGAYGIQGLGSVLVEKIEGDFFNVMGLPSPLFAELMAEEFGVYVL